MDAVQGLQAISIGAEGNALVIKYFKHDNGVATDDDHADPDLLAAGLLLERIVEDDVEVDLSIVSDCPV